MWQFHPFAPSTLPASEKKRTKRTAISDKFATFAATK
jgi:hypothetical protein